LVNSFNQSYLARSGLLILVLLLPSLTIAFEQTPHRISIAISGGASKGAYEAGLNWGILKYLQNLDELKPVSGGEFRRVYPSSFTGASAGGINTLLSSLTWCAIEQDKGGPEDSISSNLFYRLWTMPDVNRLLPPQVDSIYYTSNDALLSRHDLLNASAMLRKRWQSRVHRQGCSIPLGVTVTKVVPEKLLVSRVPVQNQRFSIIFEARTKPDGSLGFYWPLDNYPGTHDPAILVMPAVSEEGEIDSQFIEDATLASSAFPGGFGRKRLKYCRVSFYQAAEETEEDNNEVNRSEKKLYCPEGFELAEAEFSDGGLFDNLPIGLARRLSENSLEARNNPLPVTYMFMDPDRQRYESPEPERNTACDSDNPPEACQIMDFSILTEYRPVLDALGTARKFELYRELISPQWLFNIAEISEVLAEQLTETKPEFTCVSELSLFDTQVDCPEAIRRSADLLESAYIYTYIPISSPYSLERLQRLGVVQDCRMSDSEIGPEKVTECQVNIQRYREYLADRLVAIIDKTGMDMAELKVRIRGAGLSLLNDRMLRITDRGAPITGTLLSDFGAFLDLKFRQYDYYVGVYDAIVSIAHTQCRLQFSKENQAEEYQQCFNAMAEQVYEVLGVGDDAKARYLFARLARDEFGNSGALNTFYEPMPVVDVDMEMIHDGLKAALEAGEDSELAQKGAFYTEESFFISLKQEGFEPSPTDDGSTSLLNSIMGDPDEWGAELTRRMTSRAVYLEAQARDIYAEREPDPEKRESSFTELLGATAYLSQVATYNYPEFTFAPSVADKHWVWRNIIPYEIGIDIIESDVTLTWQPTWSVSEDNLIGVRGSIGFAEGIIRAKDSEGRENYAALGLDLTRRTSSGWFSSWGITPTVYHQFRQPEFGDQTTYGGDFHVSLFKDRLRLGLGTRDYKESGDEWFLSVGITDIPGMTYWLTR